MRTTRRFLLCCLPWSTCRLDGSAPGRTLEGELWGADAGNRIAVYRVQSDQGIQSLQLTPAAQRIFRCPPPSIGIGSRVRIEVGNSVPPAGAAEPTAIRGIEYLTPPSPRWRQVAIAVRSLDGYLRQDDEDSLRRSPEAYGAGQLNSAGLSLLLRLHASRIPGRDLPDAGLGGWAVSHASGERVELIHSGLGYWRGTTALKVQLQTANQQCRILALTQSDHDAYFALFR